MPRNSRHGSGPAAETHSDLARLIETEQRLAAAVGEAHRQAEALRARARETAGTMERAQGEELTALLAARAAQAGERLRQEIEELVGRGRAAAGRYASLGEDATDRLARRTLRLIRESAGVDS